MTERNKDAKLITIRQGQLETRDREDEVSQSPSCGRLLIYDVERRVYYQEACPHPLDLPTFIMEGLASHV
jgi:hypothetical protein